MTSQTHNTFSDAVDKALQLEQLAAVKQDAEDRANFWESKNATIAQGSNSQNYSEKPNAKAAPDVSVSHTAN